MLALAELHGGLNLARIETAGAADLVLVHLPNGAWQHADTPSLRHATRAEQAAAIVRETVRQSGLAAVVDAQVRFTRADVAGPDALLVQLHVVPRQARKKGSEKGVREKGVRVIF